jgi:hypothetical protein
MQEKELGGDDAANGRAGETANGRYRVPAQERSEYKGWLLRANRWDLWDQWD